MSLFWLALALALAGGFPLGAMADPIDDIVQRVSLENIRSHTLALEGPRDTPEQEAEAARYVADLWESFGYEVTLDPVRDGPNVVARRVGQWSPELTFIIGAHYDTVGGTPGADDNAVAVAGLIEIARVLADVTPSATIELIAFADEEAGLVGSYQHAAKTRADLRDLLAMISLEMIGYTCSVPGCQVVFPNIPGCLAVSNPTANVGDFLAVVGNDASAALLEAYVGATRRYVPLLPVEFGQVAGGGSCLPDSRRSDHSSFWNFDYPALLVTDTANFRNPHYHLPADTSATLNFTFAHQVTQATLASILRVAGRATDPTLTPTPSPLRTPAPTWTPLLPDAQILAYAGDGSIIDTRSNTLVGRFAGPALDLALSPDGRRLFATGSDTVSIIDTYTRSVVATVAVPDPGAVAVSQDGRFGYALSGPYDHREITIIDALSDPSTRSIAIDDAVAYGLAVSADGHRAYVSDGRHRRLLFIDLDDGQVSAEVAVGLSPGTIALSEDEGLAFVANNTSETVSIIDTTARKVRRTMLVSPGPTDIAVAPGGLTGYVVGCCHNASRFIHVVDLLRERVVETLIPPIYPSRVAVTPDGAYAYVTGSGSVVLRIDTRTHAVDLLPVSQQYVYALAIGVAPRFPSDPSPTALPITASPSRTATATATRPSTPTMTPSEIATETGGTQCAGDCDADGRVRIDELVRMVGIALERRPLSSCRSGDGNGNGIITVDELVAATRRALDGCAG